MQFEILLPDKALKQISCSTAAAVMEIVVCYFFPRWYCRVVSLYCNWKRECIRDNKNVCPLFGRLDSAHCLCKISITLHNVSHSRAFLLDKAWDFMEWNLVRILGALDNACTIVYFLRTGKYYFSPLDNKCSEVTYLDISYGHEFS